MTIVNCVRRALGVRGGICSAAPSHAARSPPRSASHLASYPSLCPRRISCPSAPDRRQTLSHGAPDTVNCALRGDLVYDEMDHSTVEQVIFFAEPDSNHSNSPQILGMPDLAPHVVLDTSRTSKSFAQHLSHCGYTRSAQLFQINPLFHCLCSFARLLLSSPASPPLRRVRRI